MTALLRRTMHHSCQAHTSNGCLIRTYGTDNRIKVKAFGLVSYSQMQHKIHATASSAPDPPELKAASIAGNAIGVASAHSLHLHNFEGFHDDQLLSEPRPSASCTVQRTTSNVNAKTINFQSFNSSNIVHQSQCHSQSHRQFSMFSNEIVSTSFVQKRESFMRLKFRDHAVHFLNNYIFDGQRTNDGFRNIVDFMPRRHYATGPRSQKRDMSYYEVLNTTPSATQAQVKEAYFKLSKIYHPDKNAGSKEAQRKFASINEAYSVLGNLTLRKRYDRGTLNQRDVHAGVKPEENTEEEEMHRDPMYTASGIPFSVEAKRQAKNMDEFFSKHYKEALNKEQRDRAERQHRIDEYMELQKKAKVSPFILAAFMITAIALAVRSMSQENTIAINRDKEQPRGDKDNN